MIRGAISVWLWLFRTLTGPGYIPDSQQVPNKRRRLDPAQALGKASPQPQPAAAAPRAGAIARQGAASGPTRSDAPKPIKTSAQRLTVPISHQLEPRNGESIGLAAMRAEETHTLLRKAGSMVAQLQTPGVPVAMNVSTNVSPTKQRALVCAAGAAAARRSHAEERLELHNQPAVAEVVSKLGKTTPHSVTPKDIVPESPELNSEDGSPAGPAGMMTLEGVGALGVLPPPTWRIATVLDSNNLRHVAADPAATPEPLMKTELAAAELAPTAGSNQLKRTLVRQAPPASRLSRGSGVQYPPADRPAATTTGYTAGVLLTGSPGQHQRVQNIRLLTMATAWQLTCCTEGAGLPGNADVLS